MQTIIPSFIKSLQSLAGQKILIQQNATQLILKVSPTMDITQLIALCTESLNNEQDRDFQNKVSTWKNYLEKMVADKKNVSTALNKLENNLKTNSLIILLKHIIQEPSLSLHMEMENLLATLGTKQLSKIFDYLAHLDPLPITTRTLKNSFFAQKINCPHQAACIDLQSKLSSSPNKSLFWTPANSILQISLSMYQELNVKIENQNNNQNFSRSFNIKS
ncbi:hypothetical protein [Legionella sp.]|uniref:hypothetical protein n=1 Tax=Legionella sp. TaxID=459 RepID=UPI003CA64583